MKKSKQIADNEGSIQVLMGENNILGKKGGGEGIRQDLNVPESQNPNYLVETKIKSKAFGQNRIFRTLMSETQN